MAQYGAHAGLGAGRGKATLAMLMVNGGQPPGQGGATGAGSREKGGDQVRAGGQRRQAALGAVVLEPPPVAGIKSQRLGRELAFDGAGPGGRQARGRV